MKKRKLLCLLAAALAFTVPFSACKDGDDDAVQVAEHELWKYFVMEEETKTYSDVYKIDGVVETYDTDHNLIVMRTEDLNNENVVTTNYTVYDLSNGESGKEIFTKSVSNLYNEQYANSVNISLHYPMIEVSETYYTYNADTVDPDDKIAEKKYSYYLIKDEGAEYFTGDIKTWSSPLMMQMVENLYVCEIDEKVYWINQDAEVLRTLNKIPVDSYYFNLSFNAEYNDYLYSWGMDLSNPLTRSIQVFDKEGVCMMKYDYPSNVSMVDVCVLNNGNLFVQEQVVLDAAEKDYDYKLNGNKFDLFSKIVDYKTGEVQELDLNFVVTKMESQYMGQELSEFPLTLKEGQQNQAYIMYFNESGIANRTNYVVLSNDLKVEYTVKNDTLDLMSNRNITVVNKDYYTANTTVNGIKGEYLFNMDGNVVTRLPENLVGITKDYIVTSHAIYDLNMNLVFDIESSTFGSNRGSTYKCSILGDKIFMMAANYLTGTREETYVFDSETKQPKLFCDGIKTAAEVLTDDDYDPHGVYSVKDLVTETYALYDEADNLLVKVQDYKTLTIMESVLVVELEVDGKDVCYVLRRA